MELQVRNSQGEVVDSIEVMDSLFGVPLNSAVVYQVMVSQRANARQGTASTKTRSDVSGGGIKPRPQKHTGRSRQGSIRAPQWRGGGIAFGPHPRDYRRRIPRRMKHLALKVILSDKIRRDDLILLDSLSLERASTKQMAKVLANLQISSSALIVTEGPNQKIAKSISNLQRVKGFPVSVLNVLDLLNHHKLIITVPALRTAEEMWGKELVRPRGHRVETSQD
ncbi:MAG: 50S ribosomal protein L4 [Chloroflexi bacterium]|nr:50S ribosomal protein L4 [Chloroflexota bacterium]